MLSWFVCWKDKIMHKNSPFPLALVSKAIVIIAVVVLILCISDVQKKNSKKKEKKPPCAYS